MGVLWVFCFSFVRFFVFFLVNMGVLVDWVRWGLLGFVVFIDLFVVGRGWVVLFFFFWGS